MFILALTCFNTEEHMYKSLFAALVGISSLGLLSCQSIPEGVTAVEDFELQKYLGTWYEIARLDHRFERGLEQVTATYERITPEIIRVTNRGYNTKKQKWEEAIGKAKFIGASSFGRLKVSFFGPFYASYNIVELDHAGYQYALVCGPNLNYLWILARTPELDPTALTMLVSRASSLGFPVEDLIYVDHSGQ